MDNQKLIKLNTFINKAYECFSFQEFLKLAIINLHELVMYDSGMFFCSISKDSSFFKPYLSGQIENYYKKLSFDNREEYENIALKNDAGNEAYVYKASDYMHGIVQIANEPRDEFLSGQQDFHIVCLRIVYKGQFMGEIYLHRSREKPDFNDEDLFLLRLVQPHVSTVFNIIHTVTAVKYLETTSNTCGNTGMCVFDEDLSLVGGNVIGLEMLKGITVFGSSVLYHAKEFCMETMENCLENDNRDLFLENRQLKMPNGDIRIQIFLNNEKKVHNKNKYVVLMQYSDENQTVNEYKFKFTKREADIIDGLIQGKNNNHIAEALCVSENTIKTHIKSIYKKTGASNRTELAYVLMLNK